MSNVLVRTVAGAACIVTLVGCAAPGNAPGTAPGTAPVAAPSLPTCGTVTPSTGLLRDVLQVRLSGPRALATGSVFHATVTVSLRPGVKPKQVPLTSGGPDLVITRGTDVVGQYEGAVGGVAFGAVITAGRPFRFPEPASVLLRGCPHRPVDGNAPDASRKQLPPGRYTVYANVDDLSGHGPSDYGLLLSQPFDLTVTAGVG